MSTTTKSHAVRTIVVRAGIVCMGVSGLGCRIPFGTTPDRVYPVSQAATHARPRYGPYAGTLPNTPEAMGAADFLDFVRSRAWNGFGRTRKCRGFFCALNLQTTEASAEAIEDANLVKIDSLASSRYGVVVGRLKNRGKHTEAKYGIPPTDDEWYLLWYADASGKPRERIVELINPSGVPTLKFVDREALVYACTPAHLHPPLRVAVADLTGCQSRFASAESRFASADRVVSSAFRKAGAWISCSQGCCTSDF